MSIINLPCHNNQPNSQSELNALAMGAFTCACVRNGGGEIPLFEATTGQGLRGPESTGGARSVYNRKPVAVNVCRSLRSSTGAKKSLGGSVEKTGFTVLRVSVENHD